MNGSEPLPHSQQAHEQAHQADKQILVSSAAGGLNGQMDVPGDKSISHRSLILAGMAVGRTNIKGLLRGEDVLSTLRAMQQLGVTIIDDADTDSVSVDGVGTGGFISPEAPLDLGNAGTGVTQAIKWAVKYHRCRGIHVTPTVLVNGLEAGIVSSSWTAAQWKAWLEPMGADNWQGSKLG